MKWLEQIILDIPYLFLKKIPYAWLGVIWFWSWPPVLAGILLGIVLVGLLMMALQNRAWEARVTREFSSGRTRLFLDHPHAARIFQIRNLALVLAGSTALGWLLNGRFGLGGLQWSLLLAGFMLLYRDALLFGATVTYIVTDQGIGIRSVPGHVDYRLFFKFREIRKATRTKVPERIPRYWDALTAQRHPREGVLLTSMRREGFSKEIQGELLLAPTNIERFLEALAGHVAVMDEKSNNLIVE
jgi:hypothetical protein